jgi:predicted phosphodiesterase
MSSDDADSTADGADGRYPIAVISDIHGNLDALQTVLADIDRRGIERIVCLGDIVGYGPDPRDCVDLVIERCEWALMGNHDYAVLYEPTNFNARAEAASFWTRRQLEQDPDHSRRSRRWKFLGELAIRRTLEERFLCVHGSPRRPINEYIFADDVTVAPGKLRAIFDRVRSACLVGHTHVQGVFTDEPEFYPPDELGGRYAFHSRERAVVNAGSVGQPRDRDPRSGYAILHERGVEFVRLEYDIEAVIHKVEAVPELNNFFGQRLLEGR